MMTITLDYNLTNPQLAQINYQLLQKKRLLSWVHMALDPICIMLLLLYLTTYWLQWPLTGQKLLSAFIAIGWLGFSNTLIQSLFKLKFYYIFKSKTKTVQISCDDKQVCSTLSGHKTTCSPWETLKSCYQGNDGYLLIAPSHLIFMPFSSLSSEEKMWLTSKVSTIPNYQSHQGAWLS